MTTRHLLQHWSACLLCGLAVLLTVTVASADECGQEQRLRATIDASEVLMPTSVSEVFTVALSGTGVGRHFGRLTFDATEIIDFRQFSATGCVSEPPRRRDRWPVHHHGG